MRAGDANSLKELYNAFYNYLFSANFAVCTHREIVKDSIHEAFLNIWVNRDKVPPVTSVGGYLNACVRRKVIDALKKEAQYETALLKLNDEHEFSYEEVIIAFQEQEATSKTLQEALLQLTNKQKEAIRLRYFENKNYEEIAQLVGCEQRTIYNRIYEAVERLRHYFSAKHTS
jgi:RNA polymerase sigma factor (sigma-70 family)